jgi:hypothetical protein
LALLVALSPCAFAQEKAPLRVAVEEKAPAKAAAVQESAPQATVTAAQEKPLPLDDRPVQKQKPLDDKAALEKEKADREEQRRVAAEKRALDYKFYKEELFKLCTIKPVMTDDEIGACKKAYKA